MNVTGEELEQHLQAAEDVVNGLGNGTSLVSLLLEFQERVGYLSADGMKEIARLTGNSETTVFSVASFYNRFRFNPPGKRHVQVCMGTACHVRRGETILDSWKRRLGIDVGETTEDREFSLERVACVGCCSMAPVTVINDEIKAKMTTSIVDGIMLEHELRKEREERERLKQEQESGGAVNAG